MLTTDVQKLLKKYKTNSIYELAERMNFLVYTSQLPQRVNGMYFYAKKSKAIALNESLTDDKKEEALLQLIKFGIQNCKCTLHLI
ncbi:hypothetical protein [Clostridium sp. JN-9]|uniref:hypothetical protein n=1 Tax=Clostridium sp. JN-9 TaxID=2507159 RepID=UPI000FFDFA9E|nr:hypothetical protein [Clostridium sp. JN-9]QAT40849.1 hypothetical protein EQM05_11565 [Clostridium sp. JN-9]